MDMSDIEGLAKAYAEARAALATQVALAEADVAAAKKPHLPKIRKLVGEATNAKTALSNALEDSQVLFRKPKSRVLHGIKVGWAKAKGKVSFANKDSVVQLIRRHMPERFEELVNVTETPSKPALSRLSGTELKKIGVTVDSDTDAVLIKPADSAIDKLVDALIDDPKSLEDRT